MIRRVLVGLLAVLSLAACTSSSGGPAAATSAGPPCLAAPSSAPSSAPTAPASAAPRVPAVKLPCFDGGAPVDLAALHGPAVVNLWGTWCPPCRTELPAIQHFADLAGGRVSVIGVITRDSRDFAGSFIADQKLTFPMLYDPDQRLLLAVGKHALPVTLFITADSRLAYVYNSTALGTADVVRLAQRYLGITVPA
jgi:thiol-disulfide isomerase/thioredoxin